MTSYIRRCAVLFVTALVLHTPTIANASHCEDSIAIAVSVQGTVEEKREDQWSPVKRGDAFCAGDMVRVRKNSRAIIRLQVEQTNITLDQHSTLSFSVKKEDTFSWVELLKGAAHFISRVPQSLKIKTPYVNAAVEGTEFLILVKESQTEVSVFEGHVALSNEQGKLDLKTGDSGLTRAKQAPSKSVKVNPVDAVQWALFYPPILTRPDNAPESVFPPTLKDDHDPQLITYYAAQLLGAGRVEEAEKNIEKAISLDQGDSNAIALKSIIALVKNQKEAALQYAQQAIKLNHSAAAHIALSYAYQAHFNLPAALDAAKDATKVEPVNSIAWARLAELHLSRGELNKALDAANKATHLDPELAHSQTILGFAYLTRIKTKNAKQTFEKAITLNPAAPLPHLGLGLAIIREGDLEQGRVEIETATSLDPRNSLLRSYVGKAYYEEKRNDLAAEQFTIAKQLDPKDPTPWFYDAIRKQVENDPVGALAGLQKARKLNDNRAVFRSRLLLDEDKAAIDVNQARIFKDLGFNQLALVEGWRALNTDPSNHSAHRFLSDSYASLPRHEIARVSELLQAQLLQPVNATPIQPQLLETKLGIFEGTGPSSASLNEYNPLFVSNGLRANASFIGGGNETKGGELIASNLYGNTVVTASGYKFETEGFRVNNDQDIRIGSLFLQSDITPAISIQAEYRKTDIEQGDLNLSFDPDNFSSSLNETIDTDEKRIGVRYKISQNSILLGSFLKIDEESSLSDGPAIEINTKRNGDLNEIQHIYNKPKFNLITGINLLKSTIHDQLTTTLPFPPFTTSTSSINTRTDHDNLYAYATLKYFNDVFFYLGGSYDKFEGIEKNDKFNPKIGITWNLNERSIFKIAAFQSLKRNLVSDKTLEPTNIAGFNQFYDDAEGTEMKRYAISFDQKLSKKMYYGIEVSKRDINTPFQDIPPPPAPPIPTLNHANIDEKFGRLYFNYILTSHSAININYMYEKFERPPNFFGSELFISLETQRLPIKFNYHRNNLTFELTTTYVEQNGIFVNIPTFTPTNDEDNFWVADINFYFSMLNGDALLSFSVKNLFDEEFQFQDTDPSKPTIYPERLILTEFSMNFK